MSLVFATMFFFFFFFFFFNLGGGGGGYFVTRLSRPILSLKFQDPCIVLKWVCLVYQVNSCRNKEIKIFCEVYNLSVNQVTTAIILQCKKVGGVIISVLSLLPYVGDFR